MRKNLAWAIGIAAVAIAATSCKKVVNNNYYGDAAYAPVTITLPRVDSFVVGKTYQIRWKGGNPQVDHYQVFLVGGMENPIFYNIGFAYTNNAGNDSVSWVVPQGILNTQIGTKVDSGFQIQFVTPGRERNFFSKSFKIYDPNSYAIAVQDSISIVTPNGGDTLAIGSNVSITWNSHGVTSVELKYQYVDGIGEFHEGWIDKNKLANTGSYLWHISDNVPAKAMVRVKIIGSNQYGGSYGDLSDDYFYTK